MRSSILNLSCALASLGPALWPAVGAAQATRAPAAVGPALHVLSVGVEDYRNPELRQRGAEDDARAFVDSLTRLAEPMYGVRARLLVGAAATREAVVAALDAIQREVRPQDVVAVYIRGLGSPRFLVLADSLPLPPPPRTPGELPPPTFERRLLRADVLGPWMAALRTRQLLLVLDTPDGAQFFQPLREFVAAAPGAREATRDLIVFAAPGPPVPVVDPAGAPHSALGAGLLSALGAERAAPIRLASAVANRLLESLDDPVMVHQAGRDLVLGAAPQAVAQQNAAALRDTVPWTSTCSAACPTLTVTGVQQVVTVFGTASALPVGARVFVNGRRARLADERWEVELPPAATREPVRIRVLLPDGTRYETIARGP